MTKNTKNDSNMGPLIAGTIGIVTGVVGATALAMKDKEIKKRVKSRVGEAKELANDKMKEFKDKLKESAQAIKDKA